MCVFTGRGVLGVFGGEGSGSGGDAQPAQVPRARSDAEPEPKPGVGAARGGSADVPRSAETLADF